MAGEVTFGTVGFVLTVANATHGHSAELVVVLFRALLDVHDASHAHTAGNVSFVPVITPDERTYRITAEQRVMRVAPENRTVTVPAETRQLVTT